MNKYWTGLGNFMLGGLLVGGVVAWLLGTELGQCRMQSVADKRVIDTLSDEHRAIADKLVVTEQQLDSAYTDLAHELGKKVDLTIPFKPVKAEQVSQVQVETDEIRALAHDLTIAEQAQRLLNYAAMGALAVGSRGAAKWLPVGK